MVRPEVSVIIPTYRRPVELAEAIASVLAQRDVSTEILVIDDCPDGSAARIVGEFPGVIYRRSDAPSCGRPALARNAGWPMATGDLVHFLDDDDRVPPGHYAAAKQAFAVHPKVGVVFGAIEPFGDVDLSLERRYFETATRRAHCLARFGSRICLAAALVFSPTLLVCSAAMIRRRCIAGIGGFDANLPLVEDVDFYGRAIRRHGAVLLDRVSIYYRIGASLMRQPDRVSLINRSYALMHARYRAEHGTVEYLAMKGLARLLGVVAC